jgi:hypothetical protein
MHNYRNLASDRLAIMVVCGDPEVSRLALDEVQRRDDLMLQGPEDLRFLSADELDIALDRATERYRTTHDERAYDETQRLAAEAVKRLSRKRRRRGSVHAPKDGSPHPPPWEPRMPTYR